MAKFDPSEVKVIAERVQEDPEISKWVTRMELIADAELIAGVIPLDWE